MTLYLYLYMDWNNVPNMHNKLHWSYYNKI